jgi:hypothetical protein
MVAFVDKHMFGRYPYGMLVSKNHLALWIIGRTMEKMEKIGLMKIAKRILNTAVLGAACASCTQYSCLATSKQPKLGVVSPVETPLRKPSLARVPPLLLPLIPVAQEPPIQPPKQKPERAFPPKIARRITLCNGQEICIDAETIKAWECIQEPGMVLSSFNGQPAHVQMRIDGPFKHITTNVKGVKICVQIESIDSDEAKAFKWPWEKEDEENARLEAEEARLKAEEEARLKAKAKARQKAEEEARLKAEKEARLKAEEEAKRKAEAKARQKAEEEARLKAKKEARLKAEEEARLKAEEEARLKAEEEARLKAEEEARLKAEEEARLKAEEEARLKAEEEARLKAEVEAQRKAEE